MLFRSPTQWSKNFIARAALSPAEYLVLLGQGSRQIQSLDQTDGLRMQFVDGDIVHLRPSGNAPELRCYVESVEEAEAQQLVQVILSAVKGLLN